MGKKLASTPRSKVKNAIRQLWLRSRERAAAIKRDKYTCQKCGVKQSKAKGKEQRVEVHHKHLGIQNWDKIIDLIFEEILVHPDELETICPECHQLEHKEKV